MIDTASNERSLATIQQIAEIKPIKDADSIELAQILGWQCVIKKGQFLPGTKAVYFEVDSFLPEDPRYEFLRKSSFRQTEFMGRGFRIKTMRMRGEISQGLVMPLSDFPELQKDMDIGEDVTQILNIKKWYVPEVQTNTGVLIGPKPYGVPTTDEVRVQSAPEMLTYLHNREFYITTKMDGTSCTVFWKDNEIGCTSRNHNIKEGSDSLYWKAVYKYNLAEKLGALGKNIAIQGELCGPGIQKNKHRLPDYSWFVYDIFDLDIKRYYDFEQIRSLLLELGLESVPVEQRGDNFNFSLEELLEMAKGKYSSGIDKEGIVVRSLSPPRVSFKVLNNDALLKDKE